MICEDMLIKLLDNLLTSHRVFGKKGFSKVFINSIFKLVFQELTSLFTKTYNLGYELINFLGYVFNDRLRKLTRSEWLFVFWFKSNL